MDTTMTRRRTSSGPAAIKTCTALYQQKQDVKSSAKSPTPDENLLVDAAAAAYRSASPTSLLESEKANTSPATSPQPHRSLTVSIPSTTTTSFNHPIICCPASTAIHMKENSPQDTAYIEAFHDCAHGLPITVYLKFNPHMISVRRVEPSEEPAEDGTYTGTTRYFGLADEGIVISEEVAKLSLGDVGQTVLQYTEIYPTSQLLRSFKQTGLLGLKCNTHGGMWHEVSVLRDCGGEVEEEDEGDEEDAETEEDDKHAVDDLEEDPTRSDDDIPEADTETPGEAEEVEDKIVTATVTDTESTPPVAATDTSAPSKQKTETQRKSWKRRANEEVRKRDNQRRMEQRRKAAAAKKVVKTPTGVVSRDGGQHDEEISTEAADMDQTEYAGGGWWVCAVM